MELIYIILYAIFGSMFYAWIHSYILGTRLTDKPLLLSPNAIYQHTKLNYLGSIVLSIVIFVISPVWYIIGIICWAFTVGRK